MVYSKTYFRPRSENAHQSRLNRLGCLLIAGVT